MRCSYAGQGEGGLLAIPLVMFPIRSLANMVPSALYNSSISQLFRLQLMDGGGGGGREDIPVQCQRLSRFQIFYVLETHIMYLTHCC